MDDMQRSFNTDLLDDPIFRKQPIVAQLLYVRLYMHRKNHFTGLFQITPEHLAVDMRLSIQEVEQALAELERNEFIAVDRERELVWVPEMRRVLVGAKLSSTQSTGIAFYLASMRICPLVRRVYESLGLPCPDQKETPNIGVSIPLSSYPSIDPPKSNSISRSNSYSLTDRQTEDSRTTPARVADSVPSQPEAAPKKEWRRSFEELASGPLDALGALDALLIGLAPEKASWEAVDAKEHATTTGLPGNTEGSWFSVWRALCEAKQPPTAEDMRKLGRWWARGGAARFKKLRFTYLGNVERFTEWIALSMAWDGESDPTPSDEQRPAPDPRSGPAVPDAQPESDTMRKIREANRQQREARDAC